MLKNIYEYSTLLEKLKKRKKHQKTLRLAFLDIDSTMTGSIKTVNSTRHKLESLGYVIIYVTARTEEMLMTSSQYNKSKKLGFKRPKPKLGRSYGKYSYLKPELIEPLGLLDPDVIASSSGTQIYIKQSSGGYLPDDLFNKNLKVNKTWRMEISRIISSFNNPMRKAFLASYEYVQNYKMGISNVYPPLYRITVTFQSARIKNEFRSFIKNTLKNENNLLNIKLTDDSEPLKDLHQLHITPRNGSKTKAVDHLIENTCESLGVDRSDLHVLIAGDGHADLQMGMLSARGTCATFILPGGSRLMPILRCKDTHPEMLDQTLESLKTNIKASIKRGHYISLLSKKRELIFCDEICRGQKYAASLLFALNELNN